MSGGPLREPPDGRALSVLFEDRLITLNRLVGLFRRRQLRVRSVAVGPAALAGLSRMTVVLHADEATAARAAEYLRNVVGVRSVSTFRLEAQAGRELALVKVRVPPAGHAELLGVARGHGCTVVDQAHGTVLLEVRGSSDAVGACIEALRQFGVLDVARTGTVAVDPALTTHPYE